MSSLKYLKNIPRGAKAIVQKGVLAAEARTAAQKAKALLREQKETLGWWSAREASCCTSKDVDKCELYLVEVILQVARPGGRLREYQTILPLRGKIINA